MSSPNTITGINDDILSKSVLDAFVANILPLTSFTTDFSAEAVKKGDKVSVPRVGAQTVAATKASHAAYVLQASDSDAVEITLGQPAYVSSVLDDVEVASSSVLSLEIFGKQKGFQLAKKVLQDILSSVTLANFGAAGLTSTASNFDADDVVDLKTVVDQADTPEDLRALVLGPTYIGALLKDNAIQNASAFGSSAPIRDGSLGKLAGFDVFSSNLVPANAQNLVGFTAHPSAMAIAMRYLKPQDGNTYAAAYPVTDNSTGITIGVREGYDNLTGRKYKIWEAVYGYTVGISAGLKRIVSA
jgi:hypothetical protein